MPWYLKMLLSSLKKPKGTIRLRDQWHHMRFPFTFKVWKSSFILGEKFYTWWKVLYLVKSFISEKFTKLLCTLLCLSFALFSCSRADSEKTKSAPWSFIVAVKAASAENNSQMWIRWKLWTNQEICVHLTFWWNGLGWEMLNKVVGLQGIKLHWEREVRVKSRQRKRRRYDDKSFILT